MQPENTSNTILSTKVSILFGVIIFIVLTIQLSAPISSTDLWWHIALGRYILESKSLIIDHSVFTWAPARAYSTYNSWISDITLYLTDQYLGTTGLISLRFMVFIGIVALFWQFSIKRGITRHPLAWVILFISLTFTWGANLIKPELFSVGLMAIVVWLYYSMRRAGAHAWYIAYLFPIIFMFWVNIHGAFFLSSLFFASAVLGELLNTKLSPGQAMSAKLRKHFFAGLALCVPAILLNPYGYELPLSIINMVLSGSVVGQQNIRAYQPTFLLNAPPLYLLDYLIASMVLFVFLIWQKLKSREIDWVVIFAYIIYCFLFIQMARLTYFLGPVFLFTGLELLAYRSRSWAWPTNKWVKGLIVVISIAIVSTIAGRVLYLQQCALQRPLYRIEKLLDPSINTIAEAATYAEQNLSGKKIGNLYEAGGYLMYRFWPGKKTLIDPRAFPFTTWIQSYFDFYNGNNIEEFLSTHSADFWLIDYKNPALIGWFSTSIDWSLAFVGPNASVFVPATAARIVPEISNKIDKLDNLPAITRILSLAFQINNPQLARRVYRAAVQNLCKTSSTELYNEELGYTVSALEYYALGDYRKAADLWKIPGKYIASKGKAADALMKLAEMEQSNGNPLKARMAYLEIVQLSPEVTMVDAYNFALLDWAYRQTNNQTVPGLNDAMHWEPITETILENQHKLQPSQNTIIDTLKQMQAGSYRGPISLLPRNHGISALKRKAGQKDAD